MGHTKRRVEPRVSIAWVVFGTRTRGGETGGYTHCDMPKLSQDDPLYCSLHKYGDPSPLLQAKMLPLLLQSPALRHL